MNGVISTLIADDEPAARAAIATLLAGDPEVRVVGETGDGASTLDAIRRSAPDLVFLDVQMPEMDGFSMLRQLEPPEMPVVVFATAWDKYALRAFDAHALDYLLKPFDDARFYQALARAKQQVRQGRLGALTDRMLDMLGAVKKEGTRHRERLVIRANGGAVVVPASDVDRIEADGDYLTIHAGKAKHVVRETMKEMEQSLDATRFVRVHRSTIVNIDRVKGLEPYYRGEYVVVLKDGSRVKLSRGYKQHLEDVLGRPIS